MVVCFIMHTTIYAQTDWHITGNAGTNATTNFIGTTDNLPLIFRTNNAERMRILSTGNMGIGINSPLQKFDVNGNINIRIGFGLFIDNHRVLRVDSAGRNTFLGNGVAVAGTGTDNTGAGYNALLKNTSGIRNTAMGVSALTANSSGSENTAIGFNSLFTNTTGIDNTATGTNALFSNTIGNFNTANGVNALLYNSTGWGNTGIGFSSLYDNTTGGDNTAVGTNAMFYNITGGSNTALGSAALESNTSGNDNTAVGYASLVSNTTGYGNTANGKYALYLNSGGVYNAALGLGAMFSNSTGSFNTAVGTDAIYNNSGSYYNCAIGYLALGYAVTPGWNNTAVGSFAGPVADAGEIYNTVSLGEESFVTASNQARIGNSSTTSIGGYANWTNISDARVKKNIKANVPGLSFINKLNPVTYNLDLDAADKITGRSAKKDKDGKMIKPFPQELNARKAKEQILYTGFVAQDVEKAAKELNYDFSGVDAAKNDRDLYGLRYAEFVVPLVKAVQELSEQNDELRMMNDELKTRLDKIEAALSINSTTQINQSLSTVDGQRLTASLEQNIPNPFNKTTTINYTLPQHYSSAKIIITDNAGKTLKETNISGTGKGILQVDISSFASGIYQYSLLVNGKLIDTKQMVMVK